MIKKAMIMYFTNSSQVTLPGREVILDTHGKDKYRRTLANVFLRDGTHLNHELVKDGWCWWYRKYAPGDTVLEGLREGCTRGQERVVG